MSFIDRDTLSLHDALPILRSMVARALVSSGLHPTIGIFHRNKYNAYCLADDVMEPYRPYVDDLVVDWMNHPESTNRSEEHTSELQSRENLVCRLLLEKKNR